MTMRRQATQHEILDDIAARITALAIFATGSVEICQASGYEALVARAGNVVALPACLVMPGPTSFDDSEVRGLRSGSVILVVIGDFNASGLDADTPTVIDLVDKLVRSFSPAAAATIPITINGVVYMPEAIQPIDIRDPDRAVFALKLATVDTPQERSTIA